MTSENTAIRKQALSSIVIIVLVLALGGVVYNWLVSLKQPPAKREQQVPRFNVEVFRAERADLREIISAFGSAVADKEVTISAQVSGEIVDVHPKLEVGVGVRSANVKLGKEGQSIRDRGDLLVSIDPKTYQERLVQAKNRLVEDDADLKRLNQEQINNERVLTKAKKDYEDFKTEHERTEQLYEKKVASRSQLVRSLLELRKYEDGLIQYENQKALYPLLIKQVQDRQQTHRTDLQLAELDLQRTEVRPPFSGKISDVHVEQGQYVRVGDPLVKIVEMEEVEIVVPISLSAMAKLEPLMQAGKRPHVHLAENETAPSRWTGYVDRVAPQADQLTRTINVYVVVDNKIQDVPLLPGTFVHARIDGPVLNQVMVIPRDAVINGEFSIAADGLVEKRPVKIEQTLQSLLVLKEGLQPGEAVILTNLDVIQTGSKIEIQQEYNLEGELKKQRSPIVRRKLAAGRQIDPTPKVN